MSEEQPRGVLLDCVRQIISHVLEVQNVGPEDDLFGDLGCDSLKAAALATTIELAFGVDLLEDLFSSSNVGALTTTLEFRIRDRAVDVQTASPSDLPAPLQPAVWRAISLLGDYNEAVG